MLYQLKAYNRIDAGDISPVFLIEAENAEEATSKMAIIYPKDEAYHIVCDKANARQIEAHNHINEQDEIKMVRYHSMGDK